MVGAAWILICMGGACPAHFETDLARDQCRGALHVINADNKVFAASSDAACISPEGKVYVGDNDFLNEDYPTRSKGAPQ